ncbi:hypothetical protein DMB65_15685 [Flavobacterium cheongpyeongense]|uniref:Uncharacterized protein n=1 Tax=Flavobacterium cheongpyeongense TaxID=2212651 RepID=A0A2V4BN56_9FLAO|nr:hypothetical protein [Flavobacterium cheongpyeongense]PXY39952.1 hypothetical protein DMB65_15685 [Flavobacterium cheongpyeongense]
MRPLIDENNLSYSKEFLIYHTRGTIFMSLLLLVGSFVGFIYFYMQNQLLGVSLMFCLFVFQIPLLIKSIKRIDEIQFRINSKGIQYRNNSLIPWSNIENEKAVYDYHDNRDNDTSYFTYQIIEPSQIMKFDLAGLSTDISELNIVLTIQRNRFKKENNIL